jgi:hypothetical protein
MGKGARVPYNFLYMNVVSIFQRMVVSHSVCLCESNERYQMILHNVSLALTVFAIHQISLVRRFIFQCIKGALTF